MGGTIGIEIERLQTSKSQSQTHTGLVGRHTVQQSDLDEWVTGGLAKGSCKPDFGSWYGLDHPQKRLTPIPVAGIRWDSLIDAVDYLVCGREPSDITKLRGFGNLEYSVLHPYFCVDNLECQISPECAFQLQRYR